MKKNCILLSLIIMLFCSGCGGFRIEPLIEGTYFSRYEGENEMFSEAKFILKEITKEEYEKANGINVFLDGTTIQLQKDDRYLSIEFYLYSVETNQYEPVTLTNFEYEGGTPHIYNCDVYLKVNDRIYTSDWSSFMFNITTDGRAFATLRLKEQETSIDMLFDAEFYI